MNLRSRLLSPLGGAVVPSAGTGSPLAPSSPLAAPSSSSGSGEEFSTTLPSWPIGETSIYVTRSRWRAVDVYLLQRNAMDFNGVFTVRVYAHVPGGIRALIATGRFGRQRQLVVPTYVPLRNPLWVAAARAQASHFEVTLEWQAGGAGADGDITVSLVASNEANEPPEWVGEIHALPSVSSFVTSAQIPDPELVSVQVVPSAGLAAMRWLHVHDRGLGVPIAGLVPAFALPICDAAGAPVGSGHFPIRFRSSSGYFYVVPSSTAGVTTIALDCFVQAVFR